MVVESFRVLRRREFGCYVLGRARVSLRNSLVVYPVCSYTCWCPARVCVRVLRC